MEAEISKSRRMMYKINIIDNAVKLLEIVMIGVVLYVLRGINLFMPCVLLIALTILIIEIHIKQKKYSFLLYIINSVTIATLGSAYIVMSFFKAIFLDGGFEFDFFISAVYPYFILILGSSLFYRSSSVILIYSIRRIFTII